MTRSSAADSRPLERFLAVAQAFRADKRWTDDSELLRWAAILLAQTEGDPLAVAREIRAGAQELRKRVKWWRDPVGGTRTFVAGALVLEGASVEGFLAELERVGARLRELKVPRGGAAEVLAVLALREVGRNGRADDAHVRRLAELFRRVKQDHRFRLGAGELPTLAMVAATDGDIDAMGKRLEAIYVDLRARGFGASNALLALSHLLYFHPEPDRRSCERFDALWKQFKEHKLRMHSGDYDEVGLLTFLPGSPSSVAQCVLAHRERIRELKPRPTADSSFSFACATTFLTLSDRGPNASRLSRLQAAYQVRTVIVARQAAAAAGAAAAV